MLDRFARRRAIGQLAQHFTDLLDDLGVIRAECNIRICMLILQANGILQAGLDLPAQSLAQCLDDGNALAVAAKVESMKIIAVGSLALSVLVAAGCSTTGSSSVGATYYHGFYDPYPCWGCDSSTIIVNPPPEKPDRPKPPIVKPPITKPPGGIGRPTPQSRPAARPSRRR